LKYHILTGDPQLTTQLSLTRWSQLMHPTAAASRLEHPLIAAVVDQLMKAVADQLMAAVLRIFVAADEGRGQESGLVCTRAVD